MPFQPLSDNAANKPTSVDLGLLLLRLITSAALVYYQLIDQLGRARAFAWEKAEWVVADRFADLGLPLPGILAVTYIALFAIALLGFAVGFFTRINSIVLFVLAGFALVAPLELSATLNPQTLVAYLAIFLALAIGGSGKMSLDHVLAGRKARKTVPY